MWTQFIITIERERNARTYHNKILFLVLKVRINTLRGLDSLNHHLRKTDEFKITGDFRGVLLELLYFCFVGIVVKETFPLE
jgi:hypothetical protein